MGRSWGLSFDDEALLLRYNPAMSALRDRVLNSPLDDLVEAAERGEIDPDELWEEVLKSLDRSADLLREMGKPQRNSGASASGWYGDLSRKQDRIDAMIARWRAELDAAGLLPPVGKEPKRA